MCYKYQLECIKDLAESFNSIYVTKLLKIAKNVLLFEELWGHYDRRIFESVKQVLVHYGYDASSIYCESLNENFEYSDKEHAVESMVNLYYDFEDFMNNLSDAMFSVYTESESCTKFTKEEKEIYDNIQPLILSQDQFRQQ
jgi:hypothetical protein